MIESNIVRTGDLDSVEKMIDYIKEVRSNGKLRRRGSWDV